MEEIVLGLLGFVGKALCTSGMRRGVLPWASESTSPSSYLQGIGL